MLISKISSNIQHICAIKTVNFLFFSYSKRAKEAFAAARERTTIDPNIRLSWDIPSLFFTPRRLRRLISIDPPIFYLQPWSSLTIQETQLSLRNRATHLIAIAMAWWPKNTPLPICYHAEFGSSGSVKGCRHKYGRTQKLGISGTPLSWDGRRGWCLAVGTWQCCKVFKYLNI